MADVSGISGDLGGLGANPGLSRTDPAQRTRQPGRTDDSPQIAPQIRRGSDEVDISPLSHVLQRLRDVASIREDFVAQLRREIDAGVYDPDARLDAALDAMIADANDA